MHFAAARGYSDALLGVDEPLAPPQTTTLILTTDAQPGDTEGAPAITVGGSSIVSTLETIGDQDYFRVELTAGQTYQIGMYAKYAGPSGVPLLDALFEIRDAAGNLITSIDSGGQSTHNSANSGYDALTDFTATRSGVYYINARAFDDGLTEEATGNYVGDYELFVKNAGEFLPPPTTPNSQSIFLTTTDTVGNDLNSTATVHVNGAPIISTIDAPRDQDFFRIEMTEGNVYRITQSVQVGGPSGVPLADAYFEIYDSEGRLLATATAGGPMPGGLVTTTVNAQLDFTAPDSGVFYVNVRAPNTLAADGDTRGELVGDYNLSVEGWDPFYSPDRPLYAIDWGTQVDRTSRNPDGQEGPRVTGNEYTGVGANPYGIEGKNVITYYFAKQGEVFLSEDPTNDVLTNMVAAGMADWEKNAFRMAMEKYEQVADIVYVEVFDRNQADFTFITYDGTPEAGILGRMSPPGTANEGQAEFNRNGPGWTEAELKPGGYSFITLIHELGHGHGLAHPHDNGGRSGVMRGVVAEGTAFDYTTGAYDLNQSVFTMMSYEDGWQTSPYGNNPDDAYGYLAGLMGFDIAAIQDKYGVNEEWATGDDSYVLKDVNASGTMYESIWDAGGTDEMVYDGARDANIDLRPVSLQYEYGGGGWVSYAHGIFGGFTIANGVTIENAKSGAGNDKLTGNDVANILDAGAGDDILLGGGGIDRLIGGEGKDVMTGGAGFDRFVFNSVLDSTREASDVITDYVAYRERIDLSGIDAKAGTAANDAFTFIGKNAFSGAAGQLRYQKSGADTIVQADVDGDKIADFQLVLQNVGFVQSTDFIF